MKNVGLFLILGVSSFLVTALLYGVFGYWWPTPAEFVGLILAAFPMAFLTYRISRYRRWPIAVFAVCLIVFGISAGVNVKKMLDISISKSAMNISAASNESFAKTGFFQFDDARIGYELTGHIIENDKGKDHYYLLPLLPPAYVQGDSIRFWAYCRTAKPKDTKQLKNIIDQELNYGMRVRDKSLERNALYAMNDAMENHRLNIDGDPIVLHWGRAKDISPWKRRFLFLLSAFTGVLIASVAADKFLMKKRESA